MSPLFFFYIRFSSLSHFNNSTPLFIPSLFLFTQEFSNAASTRAPSTEARLSPRLSTLFHFGSLSWRRNPPPPPTLSHFLPRLPVGFSLSFPILSSHPRFCRACMLQNAFPAESLSSSSSSSFRSTPRVAAGFLRTLVLALPLYQEMPRARQPRPKETDRSLSSDSSFSLTPDKRREKEREKKVGRMVVEGQRR